jgi:hypothetical protein
MDGLVQELRYAVRSLARTPGFVVVVLTLAIGIGANATVFSVVAAGLSPSARVQAPHELVNIYRDSERGGILALRSLGGQVHACATQSGSPHRLTQGALENLVAFTKLLGYVRHFHPSDEAAKEDWADFAVRGVQAVEGCGNARALADAMNGLFRRVAPTLVLFPTGTDPAVAMPGSPASSAFLLSWRHQGFTLSDRSRGTYGSERVQVPPPVRILTADLGAGLTCRLPLSVWADAAGTFPREVAAPAEVQGESRQLRAPERSTRLAAVSLAWNVLQHFYPYFDVVDTDWPKALQDALQRAAVDRNQVEFADTLRRMVAALHDGHGFVAVAGEDPTYIPPVWCELIEGRVTVVDSKTPSLTPGDLVVAINGREISTALAESSGLVSGATTQWVQFFAVERLLLGREGSRLTLDVQRYRTGRHERLELARDRKWEASGLRQMAAVTEVENGIFYLDPSRLSNADLEAVLSRLVRAKGIVFDYRGYPNTNAVVPHITPAPVLMPELLVPEITWPDRQRFSFPAREAPPFSPRLPYLWAKKAFLVDGRAISAAETDLMIVEHYRLGEIVGTPTAGTDGVATSFEVPGGFRIQFTGMKVLKQDGTQFHGVGVRPTILVTRTLAAVAEGRDEQLERAVSVVRH